MKVAWRGCLDFLLLLSLLPTYFLDFVVGERVELFVVVTAFVVVVILFPVRCFFFLFLGSVAKFFASRRWFSFWPLIWGRTFGFGQLLNLFAYRRWMIFKVLILSHVVCLWSILSSFYFSLWVNFSAFVFLTLSLELQDSSVCSSSVFICIWERQQRKRQGYIKASKAFHSPVIYKKSGDGAPRHLALKSFVHLHKKTKSKRETKEQSRDGVSNVDFGGLLPGWALGRLERRSDWAVGGDWRLQANGR